ncbi:leucine-rich repeat protein [Rubellicoccus peritrichatus]|uniref:Leucine-rich repeat protein n=1 Tax=Rubellicoccus peritrichatus TaxID=3080537 RepID=A0AAQ3LA56_9BACT|nr:leucine-rich repeat protein [Puniceicoccus sp. CR14]WOO41502.1 leucine-rich repeat protein [Puniceicoccus sp. CR14]
MKQHRNYIFLFSFAFLSQFLTVNAADYITSNGIALIYEVADGEITISDCDDSASGDLVIPTHIEDKPVTRIGDRAFYECASLTSIIIPESVTSMGTYTFWGCYSLTTVTLPKGLKSISDNAFLNCISLKSLELPQSLESIGIAAFSFCSSLENLTFPESLTSIGIAAFRHCESFTNIEIPDGVTSIGYATFETCSSLESITLPEGIENIGNYAFYECFSLAEVVVPDGVISIDDSAFRDCRSLTNVTLPDSLERIDRAAFYNTSSLNDITFPENLASIGNSAFYRSGLAQITLPQSLTSISDYAFYRSAAISILFEGDAPTDFGQNVFFKSSDSPTIYFYSDAAGFTVPSWQGYQSKILTILPPYTLSVSSTGGGSFTILSEKTEYELGDTVTVYATADSDYLFLGWSGDVTADYYAQDLVIDSDISLKANFGILPVITEHPSSSYIISGESTTLKVEADNAASYQWFLGRNGDTSAPIDGASESTLKVSPIVTSDYWVCITSPDGLSVDSIQATVRVSYTLSMSSTKGGFVSLFPFERDAYIYGEYGRVYALADRGYVFSGWSGDLDGLDSPKEFFIYSNMSVHATFEFDLANFYLYEGVIELGNDWYWSDWFGLYNMTGPDWIFHLDYGWVYANVEDNSIRSAWLFLANVQSWFWMSDTLGEGFAFDATQNTFVFWDTESSAWWNFEPLPQFGHR